MATVTKTAKKSKVALNSEPIVVKNELDFLKNMSCKGLTTIDEFLRTGLSKHVIDGCPLLRDHDCACYVHKGYVYFGFNVYGPLGDPLGGPLGGPLGKNPSDDIDDIIYYLIPDSSGKDKWLLLLNADMTNTEMDSHYTKKVISFSCNCVGNLIGMKPFNSDYVASNQRRVMNLILSEKIKLVDWTPEINQPLTQKEKEQSKNKTLKPPKFGFTRVGQHWHCPSTILFTHGGKTFICGQDEGTYFGCELKDSPETVSEAYKSLMPEEARKRNDWVRQGEWFILPVSAKDVPEWEKCLFVHDCDLGYDGPDHLPLPYERDGNPHLLYNSEVRIDVTGIYARGGELHHDQHEQVSLKDKQWYIFKKNTAVRSVSQEGVD